MYCITYLLIFNLQITLCMYRLCQYWPNTIINSTVCIFSGIFSVCLFPIYKIYQRACLLIKPSVEYFSMFVSDLAYTCQLVSSPMQKYSVGYFNVFLSYVANTGVCFNTHIKSFSWKFQYLCLLPDKYRPACFITNTTTLSGIFQCVCFLPGRYRPACLITHTGTFSVYSPFAARRMRSFFKGGKA